MLYRLAACWRRAIGRAEMKATILVQSVLISSHKTAPPRRCGSVSSGRRQSHTRPNWDGIDLFAGRKDKITLNFSPASPSVSPSNICAYEDDDDNHSIIHSRRTRQIHCQSSRIIELHLSSFASRMSSVQQENGGAADHEMQDAVAGAEVDGAEVEVVEPQRLRVVCLFLSAFPLNLLLGSTEYEPDTDKKQLPGSTDTAASFEFTREDHTLGNALRWIIMKK